MANATNTLALFPGSLAGAMGFRRELGRTSHWLRMLLPPSLLRRRGRGGAPAAHVAVALPSDLSVPGVLAAGLLALQDRYGARIVHVSATPSTGWRIGALCFQFLVGVYGGFFGAGIGILMLAALGALGVGNIHEMNGLKNVLAMSINVVAATYFAVSGAIVWSLAAVMAVGAIVGGFAGASVSRPVLRAHRHASGRSWSGSAWPSACSSPAERPAGGRRTPPSDHPGIAPGRPVAG